MKLAFIIALVILLYGCDQHKTEFRSPDIFTGNNKIEFKQIKSDRHTYRDLVDDTINYKEVANDIFQDTAGRIFRLDAAVKEEKDSTLFIEFYKDVSALIDIRSYKQIEGNYFSNKNKVYLWFGNSDGPYPQEIKGADPKTFVPFENVAGGHDKFHAYYGGPPSDFEIIEGADPKTIKTLNPKEGCWNCSDCYFIDDKNVFSGFAKLKNADRKTFKLINTSDSIDAEDKNFTYYKGEVVDRKINTF